jgi:hypothetical protein
MQLTRSQARRAELMAKRKAALMGHGVYIFENNTKGDILLPRPTKSGRKSVGVGEQFVGDDYYMYMLKSGEIKLIEVVEDANMPEKLITDQPPIVSHEGNVEYHKVQTQKKLNESDNEEKEEVLLTESPLDGITIL